MAREIGSRLGHYAVTALIGEGGTGQVYRALALLLFLSVGWAVAGDVAVGEVPPPEQADTTKMTAMAMGAAQ